MDFILNIGRNQLNLLPVIDNGGIVAYFLDLIKLNGASIDTSGLSNINGILNHLKQLLFNSSLLVPVKNGNKYNFNDLKPMDNTQYSNITIGLIIWLVLILLILLIWIIIDCCYIRRNRYEIHENYKFIFVKQSKTVQIRAKQMRLIRIISMIIVIVFSLLWIGILIMLFQSFTLMNHSIGTSQNNSVSNDNTNYYKSDVSQITNGLSEILQHLHKFELALSSDTTNMISKSVRPISDEVNLNIEQSIWGFGNRVLSTFNVTQLIEVAKELTDGIKTLIKNLEIIRIEPKTLFPQINQIKGGLKIIMNSIDDNFEMVCSKLTSDTEKYQKCIDLQIKSRSLKTDINTTIIITSPGVVLNFVLNNFQINITEIIREFDGVNKTLYSQLEPPIKSIIQQVEVSQYISIIPQIWDNLANSIVPFISNYSSVNSSLDEYLSKYQLIQNIVFIIVLLVVFLLTILLIFLIYIPVTFLNRGDSFISSCNSIFVILLLLICFIISIVSSLFIILPVFINSHACTSLSTSENVMIIDQKINEKLASNWDTLVSSLGLNDDTSNIKIKLTMPTNILDVISNQCRNNQQGLLKLFNISDNLVNVRDILDGPAVAPMIRRSKNESFKAFIAVNPAKVIPTDQLGFIDEIKVLLKYFDEFNYQNSIKELKKPLVGVRNVSEFTVQLHAFIETIKGSLTSDDMKNAIDKLSNLIINLNDRKVNYNSTQLQIDRLRQKYQELQNATDLARRIELLRESLDNLLETFKQPNSTMYRIFSKLYDEDIQSKMVDSTDKLLTNSLQRLFSSIIQCGDLPKLYDAAINTFCNKDHGFVTVLMTMGVLLISANVATVVLAVLVGAFVQFFYLHWENISKA